MGNIFSQNDLDDTSVDNLLNENQQLKKTIKVQNKIIRKQECMINATALVGANRINSVYGDFDNSIQDVKNNKNYEYLVFSGGGIKGVSYCGALSVLDKLGILKNIKGYAGTSAGSITASLLALGMDIPSISSLIKNLDFEKIVDDKIGIIRDTYNFVEGYGVCPGKYIHDFLGQQIKKLTGNPDYTIKQLYDQKGIQLVIVTTDMNNEKSIYFYHNHPDERYSNIPIRQAIRMSMSIPFLFEPVLFDSNYCVDGGVLDNYAIHVFDGKYPGDPQARLNTCTPNPKVLGLKIITVDDVAGYKVKPRQDIKNLFNYGLSYINTFMTENDRRVMTHYNYMRTIFIVTEDYPLTDFSLNDAEKEDLISDGTKCTQDYFAN